MDAEAGMALTGWCLYKSGGKGMHGGLSSSIKDAAKAGASEEEAAATKQKINLLCSFLFKRSKLDHHTHHLYIATIMRYWKTFQSFIEKDLKQHEHSLTKYVIHACNSAGVSYDNEFLTWCDNCNSRFKAKNFMGIPSQAICDIPQEFVLDGRNLIDTNHCFLCTLNNHSQDLSTLTGKAAKHQELLEQANETNAALKDMVIAQSKQIARLQTTMNELGHAFSTYLLLYPPGLTNPNILKGPSGCGYRKAIDSLSKNIRDNKSQAVSIIPMSPVRNSHNLANSPCNIGNSQTQSAPTVLGKFIFVFESSVPFVFPNK